MKAQNQTKKENANTLTGKVEIDIAGTRYIGTIDFATAPVATTGTNHLRRQQAYCVIPAYTVYGVRIRNDNKDPFYSVEYTDAAAGFLPATPTGAGSWADKFPFNAIKPCLFKDGAVVGYLNPDNYSEFDNGATTSGDGGDVMVEFPKVFYKICTDEFYTYVKISESPLSLKDGFTDWAHSYKGVVRDKFYIGAYKGYVSLAAGLTSMSGVEPTTNATIGEFRTEAHKRGDGYEILPFNKLILLQALYLIRYKSLNSQAALGMGYTDGNGKQNTGGADKCGMYYGTPDGDTRVKCHGLEDFWGNVWECVDGLISKDGKLFVADGDFNDSASGYVCAGKQTRTAYGYIKSVKGDNKLGFLINEGGASDNAYYSDYGYVDADSGVYVALFGGDWGYGAYAGAFVLYVADSPSYAYSFIAARLCFCG